MVDAVVVDDSQFMRVQITELLEDGGITVVDDARNGKEAVDVVCAREPDVVTMDVKMPGMDGIEAVEQIMDVQPTPILMLSRYTEEGGETTFEALEAGAVDVFMKPGGEVSTTLIQYADDLVDTVSVVAQADVSAGVRTGQHAEGAVAEEPPETPRPDAPPTILVGASTGGPPELQTLLSSIPATLEPRVIIVQHMPDNFTDRFATRLDSVSDLSVGEATAEGAVGPGEAVVAKGGYHLVAQEDDGTDLAYELCKDDPVHNVRPAADVTFESVAKVSTTPPIGVVLTGMGRDGAVGVEWVADVDGTVVVQDPDTASIAAMPTRAIETGVVDHVVPTREIPQQLLDTVFDDDE